MTFWIERKNCVVSLQSGSDNFPRDADGNLEYVNLPLTDTWSAMEKCVDEGLVKSIGLSNFNSQQIQNILDNCRIKPAVLQVMFDVSICNIMSMPQGREKSTHLACLSFYF